MITERSTLVNSGPVPQLWAHGALRSILFLFLLLSSKDVCASPPDVNSPTSSKEVDGDGETELELAKLPASNAEASRIAYQRGALYMREGMLATALEYFQTSLALDPHPLTKLMMASIESGMGHYTRAYKLLKQVLAQSSQLNSEQTEAATELMNTVRKRMGRFRLTVSKPNVWVLVDGRPIEVESGENSDKRALSPQWLATTSPNVNVETITRRTIDILVDAGLHRIAVHATGFHTVILERAVEGEESVMIDVRLTSTFWRKASAGLMVAAGAGIIAGTGLFLSAAANKNSALDYCNKNWICLPTGRVLLEKSKDEADAATVIIPTSLIIGTTGLLYWLATFRPDHQEMSRNAIGTIYPNIIVGRHECMFSISGSF